MCHFSITDKSLPSFPLIYVQLILALLKEVHPYFAVASFHVVTGAYTYAQAYIRSYPPYFHSELHKHLISPEITPLTIIVFLTNRIFLSVYWTSHLCPVVA